MLFRFDERGKLADGLEDGNRRLTAPWRAD